MVLDNLILNVQHVTFDQFQEFCEVLQRNLLTDQNEERLTSFQLSRAREYHYNVIVGSGGGASYIGYMHNSEKVSGKGFTLKLEVNPNKRSEKQDKFAQLFADFFSGHKKLIKGGEIALDIPVDPKRVMAVSLTGRTQDRHKGTVYFGSRGKNGYLKIYDKKKEYSEVQKVQIDSENLTRLEFSFRVKEGLNIQQMKSFDVGMNELYKITIFDESKLDKCDAITKALVYSYANGFQDIKEFTYTYKKKIKKALDSMEILDMDGYFKSAKVNVIDSIRRFTNPVPKQIIA
jgi:Replication initiation factor